MDPLEFHKKKHGKIEIKSRVFFNGKKDILNLAYTPGVAKPCIEINKQQSLVNIYTRRWNSVAIITDGSAVLGLGNLGPKAALPVMEGKAVLFKEFGAVDAFPICLEATPSEIIKIVKSLEPTFGGINLEDIAAPHCFEIETELKELLNIPVFHDDQHGTAVVVLAGLINAASLLNMEPSGFKIIISGAGAAGLAIAKLLIKYGVEDIIVCDSKGAISKNRSDISGNKKEIAKITNPSQLDGTLDRVIRGRSVFIGVSAPGILNKKMIKTMAENPIIFAMSNPIPEIYPQEAKEAGAAIVATGRSDFPNQINNVLAFPGIFRGALDVEAKDINEDMKMAAAFAIAEIAQIDGLKTDYIVPDAIDLRVGPYVAGNVVEAAVNSKVAGKVLDKQTAIENAKKMLETLSE